MLAIIGKKFIGMAITMLVLSFIVFLALEVNLETLATKVLGPFATDHQKSLWLEQNGYTRPFLTRYVEWLFNFVQGDLGNSTRFKTEVTNVLWPRLINTGWLVFFAMLFLVPLGLLFGILAGMKEGGIQDRIASVLSILTTSIPDYAWAVILVFIFVVKLRWLPGISNFLHGFDFKQIILPALALSMYAFGYIARMTRASMAEAMSTQYVRTAILKGIPMKQVILRHALRNALIAPFTVIVLMIPWILSGVVVIEFIFAFKGFGSLLLEGALNQDINVIVACTMVSVVVVVATQVISDIGYTMLNPRIRYA